MAESFFVLFLIFFTFCMGSIAGFSTARPQERETTVKFCIEKPAECKKEYDFYQMRTEFEASKEKTE